MEKILLNLFHNNFKIKSFILSKNSEFLYNERYSFALLAWFLNKSQNLRPFFLDSGIVFWKILKIVRVKTEKGLIWYIIRPIPITICDISFKWSEQQEIVATKT